MAGGFNGSNLASAEQFDAGLAPVVALQPALSAVNAFLLQVSQLAGTSPGSSYSGAPLAIAATGFRPADAASGGATNDSASNSPVFQIERIDNQRQVFVPNDETVNITDTVFTGSASALAGFPAGPVLVRTWVNGVPSAARYSTLAVTPGRPAVPTATGGVSQATVTFTPVTENGGAPITSYTATASPGGATASCTTPCTTITFNPIAAGTYTFTITATNAAGTGPASAASNSVIVRAQSSTSLVSATNPSTFGQGVTFTATVTGQSLAKTEPTSKPRSAQGSTYMEIRQKLICRVLTLELSGRCRDAHDVTANSPRRSA